MSEKELELACGALEGVLKRKELPERRDLRGILIAYGELVLAGDEGLVERHEPRIKALRERLDTSWDRLVVDELALACAEHVHAVDPRYLGLPNYDLAYTLEARERLESRRAAALALGHEVPAALWDQVIAADRALEAHLASRGE